MAMVRVPCINLKRGALQQESRIVHTLFSDAPLLSATWRNCRGDGVPDGTVDWLEQTTEAASRSRSQFRSHSPSDQAAELEQTQIWKRISKGKGADGGQAATDERHGAVRPCIVRRRYVVRCISRLRRGKQAVADARLLVRSLHRC